MKYSFHKSGWPIFLFMMAGFFLGSRVYATVGANTPFADTEAETGLLGGGASVVSVTTPPLTPYSSPELEASGHAFVQLTGTGQFLTLTNKTGQSVTALNLRSCIPDVPTGGGMNNSIDMYVNGTFRQAFSVNSLQNYCYEGTNYNGQEDKNPADGNPRGFWNDTHAFIVGAPVAPGDTITFRKDSSNTAAFYYIDVVDLENPSAPFAQPSNSLSILSYGAISNNVAFDNTAAINNCFIAAQSQGKTVYIPPGTFYFSAINGGLRASGITIQGAGSWYSTLYRVTPNNNGQGVNNIITTTSSTLRDVALDCNSSCRAGVNNNGAVNFSGNNWVVDGVWIQHTTSAFWCSGMGGIAKNCRVLSVWSDGGNFNNVEGSAGIGRNLTYSNNFVRGTGDDAMAINSVNYNVNGSTTTYYTMMSNITYVNNTAIGAWGGKGIGIYGGINDVVANNLLRDTARYIGLGVGKFGVNGSDLVSATVLENTVLRCGGNGYGQQQQAMMIGNAGDGQSVGMVANTYCASNTIIDSIFSAVGFSTGTNNTFQYNTIINPGQNGIIVGGGSLGIAVGGNVIINSNFISGIGGGFMACSNSAAGYAVVVPVAAAKYLAMSGVVTEPCAEGGQDITDIESGDWTAYADIDLTGVNTFVARVASGCSGGTIELHLDEPAGTFIGTCAVPNTGGTQTFLNTYGVINGVTGTHTVYLVYTGGTGVLFNVQFFGLYSAPPVPSHHLIAGNTYALRSLANGKYVFARNGGSNSLAAMSVTIGTPEQFQVVDAGGGNLGLLALVNTQFVCSENNGASPLIANRSSLGSWETFTEFDAGGGNISLRAQNDGRYVAAPNGGSDALIAQSTSIGIAESFQVIFVGGVPPIAPANLTVHAGNNQAALTWIDSAGASTYNIKRSTTSGGSYVVITTNVTSTAYIDHGLVNGTAYYYVVSVLNPAGESANSVQVYTMPGTLDRTMWVASSSTAGSDLPGNALDGDLSTRWSTGASQANGQWFQVDLGEANTFNKIVLNAANSANDYPRGYQVYVSTNGVNWGTATASGTGSSAITTITLAAQAARYIRIVQTGSAPGTFWSIHEFNAFGTTPTTPAALAATVGDGQVSLTWPLCVSADGYNVKRAVVSGGVYTTVAVNLTGLNYVDAGLADGTAYFYIVTATNGFGESAVSPEVVAQPVSLLLPQLGIAYSTGRMQLHWPSDHRGWRLESQTNFSGAGLGMNWVTVANSTTTNEFFTSLSATNGCVFFRLAYP